MALIAKESGGGGGDFTPRPPRNAPCTVLPSH